MLRAEARGRQVGVRTGTLYGHLYFIFTPRFEHEAFAFLKQTRGTS